MRSDNEITGLVYLCSNWQH